MIKNKRLVHLFWAKLSFKTVIQSETVNKSSYILCFLGQIVRPAHICFNTDTSNFN